jgi:hypothetical protein
LAAEAGQLVLPTVGDQGAEYDGLESGGADCGPECDTGRDGAPVPRREHLEAPKDERRTHLGWRDEQGALQGAFEEFHFCLCLGEFFDDQFQLFNAPGYSGSFSSTILPPLNAGLRWNNNLLVNGSIGVGVIPPPAAIPLSGGTYTQDFNTLATNGLANTWDGGYTLFGWFAGESLSPLTITSYRAGSGTDLTGALYSFGSSGSNERALGSLASATPGTIGFGVCFTNDTAASVSNFTVSYTGEQWRSGGSGSVTNTLSFWYRVGAPPLTNPEPGIVVNWTAVTNLFFPSPIVSATAGALDGNQAANQHVLAATSIPGLIVPPGQEVFFRWTDPDDAGFDQAMAVDDLTVAFTILAPRISSIASNPTNHFATISGIGEPGFTYGIEAASNLNAPVFWQRLGSVTADTTGIFQFTDTNAPLFQVRFYRTLIP